jgi:hypothetical protein
MFLVGYLDGSYYLWSMISKLYINLVDPIEWQIYQVDYLIKFNLLKYLMTHVSITCLFYNFNDYKMCMSTY